MEIPTHGFSKELQKEIAGVEQQLSLLALDALQQIEALNEFLQFLTTFQPNPNDPEPDPFLQFLAAFPLPSHLIFQFQTRNPKIKLLVGPLQKASLNSIGVSIVNRDGIQDEYKRFLQAKRSKSG